MREISLFTLEGQTVFAEMAEDMKTVLRYVSYPQDAYDPKTGLFDKTRAIEVEGPA